MFFSRQQIIDEGLKLARPSLCLHEEGSGRPVAIWNGTGIVPPPPGSWSHWITVDCDWLANHGYPLRGCLSLYQDNDNLAFTAVSNDATRLPEEGIDGVQLFGYEILSIPPMEALDVCGSKLTELWFAEATQERSNVEAITQIDAAYDEEYRKRCPLWDDSVVAVLGGWHTFWPDSDDYQAEAHLGKLVLWTFRGAEPWVEVWCDDDGGLTTIPRIT